MSGRSSAVAAIIFAGIACSAPDAISPSSGADASPTERSSPADAGVESSAEQVGVDVRLHVARQDGMPVRLYAFVTLADREVALLVDTGSQVTFLSTRDGPDGQANVGTVLIGSERRSLIGRPIAVPDVDAVADGRPVVGYLGNDWFLEKPREIDLVAARIRTTSDAPPAGWLALPFENRKGYLFVMVRLDGEPLVLGFDTGAQHALWLGQGSRPSDIPLQTQDANGTPITIYLGNGLLELDGESPRTIPVLRAPSFPSLEASNKLVGGKIDGLFGLSSFAGGKVRIDAARSTIWVAPR